jgi:hypothetical protein
MAPEGPNKERNAGHVRSQERPDSVLPRCSQPDAAGLVAKNAVSRDRRCAAGAVCLYSKGSYARVSKAGTHARSNDLLPGSYPGGPCPGGFVAGRHIHQDQRIHASWRRSRRHHGGSGRRLWLTELGSSQITRITTAWVITSYYVPNDSERYGITVGSAGDLWFTEFTGKKIAGIPTCALGSP